MQLRWLWYLTSPSGCTLATGHCQIATFSPATPVGRDETIAMRQPKVADVNVGTVFSLQYQQYVDAPLSFIWPQLSRNPNLILCPCCSMDEQLPDEVLETVLENALCIFDIIFEAWRLPHTFAGSPRSTASDILLVSKRWHDLGKPWLYESAIIRTREQAHALAEATCKSWKSSRRLGSYLRRLRIDCGYSDALGQVLRNAPKIDSLYLGFDISVDDHTGRLMRAFRAINPSRLYLDFYQGIHDSDSTLNFAPGGILANAVAGALRYWTKLKRIDCSPHFVWFTVLVSPLTGLKALNYVSMTNHTALRHAGTDIIQALIANPSVRVIQIRDGTNWLSGDKPRPDYPRAKIFLGSGTDMVSWADFPAVNPRATPSNLPTLPEKLWSRIIHFATYWHAAPGESTVHSATRTNATRWAIVLTSSQFYSLGIHHLYGAPILVTARALEGFIQRITAPSRLSSLVCVLDVDAAIVPGQPRRLCAALTNLLRVNRGVQVFPCLLQHVPQDYDLALESMDQVISPSDLLSPSSFLQLRRLRSLTLRGGACPKQQKGPSDLLGDLRSLVLYDVESTLILMFTSMQLPRLREFGFSLRNTTAAATFLSIHGRKIHKLSMDYSPQATSDDMITLASCPNLSELHLLSTAPPSTIPFGDTAKPQCCLRSLTLPLVSLDSGDVQLKFQQWRRFVHQIRQRRDSFPALDEVRILSMFDWPLHQDHYQRSLSRAAHIAHELHAIGVALSDRHGIRWVRFDALEYNDYAQHQFQAFHSLRHDLALPLPLTTPTP
ncbi:hypothetical protein PYCCODRAFT_965959 [Trametes coccinea BRFM310]|uniref:F-box domain-containing protein n=1 Tax=Trametes coccinea (strain BRFM310) TaxID=1353009 RepID=A0A1Y2IDF0_TRAC3|nr:hypothetical protein PYCCODRAFT_965959 [Trametes coccinea BRFM310]